MTPIPAATSASRFCGLVPALDHAGAVAGTGEVFVVLAVPGGHDGRGVNTHGSAASSARVSSSRPASGWPWGQHRGDRFAQEDLGGQIVL